MKYSHIADDVVLGKDVVIHDFVNLYGCEIGDGTKIANFVEIQRNVSVGHDCKISCFTVIVEGVHVGDGCFIGSHVSFVNDKFPRATNSDGSLQTDDDWTVIETYVENGASIGSGATILCGITIGEKALVGAGAVVTSDVPAGAIVVGSPAREIRPAKTRVPRLAREPDQKKVPLHSSMQARSS